MTAEGNQHNDNNNNGKGNKGGGEEKEQESTEKIPKIVFHREREMLNKAKGSPRDSASSYKAQILGYALNEEEQEGEQFTEESTGQGEEEPGVFHVAINYVEGDEAAPIEIPTANEEPGAYRVGATQGDHMDDEDMGGGENDEEAPPQETPDTVIEGAEVVEEHVLPSEHFDVSMAFSTAQFDAARASEEMEVVDGQLLRPSNLSVTRRKSWLAMGLCLAMAALVVTLILLVATLVGKDNGDNGSRDESMFMGLSYINARIPFQEGLPAQVVKEIKELPDSAFHKANKWMWDDSNMMQYSPEKQRQRFLMATLYHATVGPNWTRNDHWLSYQVPDCDWYHQPSEDYDTLCDEDGILVNLNLSSNNLQGTFPTTQLAFEHMRIFDLGNNNISGPVPTAVGNSVMEVIIISNNQFSGQLVATPGYSAFGMRVVKFDGNNLHGYAAPIFRFLPRLEVLDIGGNSFDREVFKELQYCKNLTYLGMADNLISGSIPTQYGVLTKLEHLDVSGNTMVTGVIPTELGLLPNLQFLGVDSTAISSSVPASLCEKENLTIMANCSNVQCCK